MRNLALLDVQLLWERAWKALISGPQDSESISQTVHDLAWCAWCLARNGHRYEGAALLQWLMEEPNISHLRSYAIGAVMTFLDSQPTRGRLAAYGQGLLLIEGLGARVGDAW